MNTRFNTTRKLLGICLVFVMLIGLIGSVVPHSFAQEQADGPIKEEPKTDMPTEPETASEPESPGESEIDEPQEEDVPEIGMPIEPDEEQIIVNPVESDSQLAQPSVMSDFSLMQLGYNATAYYPATGNSTNDHYTVKGVFIGTDNNVYLILDNDKATANQTRFYNPVLNGKPAAGYGLPATPPNSGDPSYQDYWDGPTTRVDLNIGGTTQSISGVRMYVFNLGPMIGDLEENNSLSINNGAGGFAISGMTFSIKIGHEVTKSVAPSSATIGQEVIYTIKVKNTGDFPMSGFNLMDKFPAETTILGVSQDGGATYDDPVFETIDGSPQLVVDSNITLLKNQEKTYYVKAFINSQASNGQTLTNRAYTSGATVSKYADASVTVKSVSLILQKKLTGNLADFLDKFQFSITVNPGETSPHFTTINIEPVLGHNEEFVLPNLPIDGVVSISEDNKGYIVSITVDGVAVDPADHECSAILNGKDLVVVFTNHREAIIPTGITLDSLPYILLLALALAGVVVMVIRKRKQLND